MRTPNAGCAECRTLIGGYVLDALEPDEADAVRRHLADCPACASEHERLAGLPALLAVATDDERVAEQPPAALEEAVLDRFAREQRPAESPGGRRVRAPRLPRRLRHPAAAALAGAAAAAAASVAITLAVTGAGDRPHGDYYQAELAGTRAAPTAHASAKLETSSSGTSVHLSVRGLPGQPDDLYELWCIRDDGTKISAGTFRVDARGHAYAVLTTAAVPGEYRRMSVERRTPPHRRAGQRVMAGTIRFGKTS